MIRFVYSDQQARCRRSSTSPPHSQQVVPRVGAFRRHQYQTWLQGIWYSLIR